MLELLGRLHPVLVHLPIGILLLAGLFEWLSVRPRFEALRPALPLMFQLGAAAAVFSCASGWLLASGGEYEGNAVFWHRWAGIGTAIAALGACFLKTRRLAAGLIVVLVAVTGHLGGALTHGAGYLTAPFAAGAATAAAAMPTDVQQAKLYADLVAPVLKENCSACHGAGKQKGGLRLDTPEFIQKGGKNGPILTTGQAEQSEMIRRLLLPPGDEEHMPPKEKKQPSAAEIELLRWWIVSGADFHKRVAEIPQPEPVKAMLASLRSGDQKMAATAPSDIPAEAVEPAPADIVAMLQKAGVAVLPLGQNNNYLSLNFVNVPKPADSLFAALEKLQKQAVWLRLSGCTLSDTALQRVGRLSRLTKLYLDNSTVADAQLAPLRALTQLRYLNLTHTGLGVRGIAELKNLPALKQVFAFNTAVKSGEWAVLRNQFPGATLDSGGYVVPTFAGDTTLIQAKKK
jgi:mono/diheme cytochrome c family protein